MTGYREWLDGKVDEALDNFERRHGWRRERLNHPRPKIPVEPWPVEQPLENYYKVMNIPDPRKASQQATEAGTEDSEEDGDLFSTAATHPH